MHSQGTELIIRSRDSLMAIAPLRVAMHSQGTELIIRSQDSLMAVVLSVGVR
jgi:hypothetical protein